MMKFNVTFETITPESAEDGDTATRGFISKNVTLREAIADLGSPDQGFGASVYPVSNPQWITAYDIRGDFQDEIENRSLHFPDNMTAASKLRVCKMLGVYGA